MPQDHVVTVRQIGGYPQKPAAGAGDLVLAQQGGLGGAYYSTTPLGLLKPLETASLPIGIGAPEDTGRGNLLAQYFAIARSGALNWNAYWDDSRYRTWLHGPAGQWTFDVHRGLAWGVAPAQPAGTPIPAFVAQLILTTTGDMRLPFGSLKVARDPQDPLEVATQKWVQSQTVTSFMGRQGRVQLHPEDVYHALGLASPIATESHVNAEICNAINVLLARQPFVWSFQGRVGNVWLYSDDVSMALTREGAGGLSNTPPADADGAQIVTAKWVRDYVEAIAAGVVSFNGRVGVVVLELADVNTVFMAPGAIPLAPTAVGGTATNQIASTAFVQVALLDHLPLDGSRAMTGALNFGFQLGINLAAPRLSPAGDADATNKRYVDDLVASSMLLQGIYAPATNAPDLSVTTAFHPGYTWMVSTADPHVAELTTTALPGIAVGTSLENGDRLIWNGTQFFIVHQAGITQSEADTRYLQLAGGTLTPATAFITVPAGQTYTANQLVPKSYVDTILDPPSAGVWLRESDGTVSEWANTYSAAVAAGASLVALGNTGAGTAVSLSNTAAGSALTVANSGTGRGIMVTGTGPGIYVNSNGTNVDILRQATAGIGLNINFANAGIAGQAARIAYVGATSVGLYLGSSTEAASAIEVWRWTPTTEPRWILKTDGSQLIYYDGTGSAFELREGAGAAAAVMRFQILASGTVNATAAVNLATVSGAVTVGSATGPVNSALTVRGATSLAANAGSVTVGSAANTAAQLSVRGQVNLSTDAGGVYLGTTAYPASVWSYGAGNLAMQSGTVTIGTATNNDPQPTVFVPAPPGGQNARPILTGHDNTTWAQAPFTWRLGSSTSDGLKIRLPYSLASNVMFLFTVRIFSNYHHADLNFSGYLYTGNGTFYMPLVTCSDSTVAGGWRVIMGLDSDNRGYVYIKAERTGFSWGGICVCNVLAPYGGGNFRNGWELVRVPTLDTTIAPNRYYDRNVDFYNGTFFNYVNDVTFAPGWSFYIPQTPRLDFNGREVKFKATIQWQPSVVWPGGQNYLSPFAGPFGTALRPMTSHYMPATVGLPAGANYATYIAVYPDGLFHIWLPAGAPNNTDGLCFVDCSWWTADGAPQRWGVGFNS